MKLLRSRHEETEVTAGHALRRYVRDRAAGRVAAEYARADRVDGIAVWIGCHASNVDRLDGKNYRRIRIPGEPWCPVLGRDTSIAGDRELQAFFTLTEAESDPHTWTQLYAEVTRNRLAALRRWRSRGRAILAKLHRKDADPAARQPSAFASRFLVRGTGIR